MKHANFTLAMRVHDVRKIERHPPDELIQHEWFSVWLVDSILPGTGRTVADAYAAAVADLQGRLAA